DLEEEGAAFDRGIKVGMMVEVPSAVIMLDRFCDEVDFFSIGTNDLIQYALAADREDEHVGYLYHPLHPAILRALRQIVVGAERMGKPVAMCGDMGGDPTLAWVLIGLGLRNLSMAPRQIPVVKSIIRSTEIADAERLLAQALTMSTETEIEELVYGVMNRRFPLELNDGEDDRPPG
ncbi:MAG TPA: putative PEP-binding protein, partial [Polyangia bacterium]|nr:putative PEP-binding protein [Polyangia bacterium]